jgi:excisionase family DNA binding protein
MTKNNEGINHDTYRSELNLNMSQLDEELINIRKQLQAGPQFGLAYSKAQGVKALETSFFEKYWKVRDVAELLQLPTRSVYALVWSRKIPHYRIGRSYRFNPQEIRQWLQSKRKEHSYE